jgi:hypothetical protein
MNPETGIMNVKSLKVVPKPLAVKISSVKKDANGMIRIEKKENIID